MMRRFAVGLLVACLAWPAAGPGLTQTYEALSTSTDDSVLLNALYDDKRQEDVRAAGIQLDYYLSIARRLSVPQNRLYAYHLVEAELANAEPGEGSGAQSIYLEELPVYRLATDAAMRRGDFERAEELFRSYDRIRRRLDVSAGTGAIDRDMNAAFAVTKLYDAAAGTDRSARQMLTYNDFDNAISDYRDAEAGYRKAAAAYAALYGRLTDGYTKLSDLADAAHVNGGRASARLAAYNGHPPKVIAPPVPAPPPTLPLPPSPQPPLPPPPPPAPGTIRPLDQIEATASCPKDENNKVRDGYTAVPVFYGTTRRRSLKPDPAREVFYDNAPGETDGAIARIDYGLAQVSIPCRHKPGKMERPLDLKVYKFEANENRDIKLLSATSYSGEAEFLDELGKTLDLSTDKALLVYVHGFNQGFDDGARRAAQIGYDMKLSGATAFFSWPSKHDLFGYWADQDMVSDPRQIAALKHFLLGLRDRTGATHFYVAAHSLGNRFLLRALAGILADEDALPVRPEPRIRELVLGSPDVPDTEEFKAIWPRLHQLARRTTLYASSADMALMAADLLAGPLQGGARRVGDGSIVIQAPTLETVNTTEVGGEGLGHDDWASVGVDDLRSIFWFSLEPRQRCVLTSVGDPENNLWAITKATTSEDGSCPGHAYRQATEFAWRLRSTRRAQQALMGDITIDVALSPELLDPAAFGTPLHKKAAYVLDVINQTSSWQGSPSGLPSGSAGKGLHDLNFY